jgi:hypothetical protein
VEHSTRRSSGTPSSNWIDHYYQAAKDSIALRQKSDPLVWQDLVTFVAVLRKLQAEREGIPAYREPSPEEVIRFLEEELTEAA